MEDIHHYSAGFNLLGTARYGEEGKVRYVVEQHLPLPPQPAMCTITITDQQALVQRAGLHAWEDRVFLFFVFFFKPL